jgi:hypothetical protein
VKNLIAVTFFLLTLTGCSPYPEQTEIPTIPPPSSTATPVPTSTFTSTMTAGVPSETSQAVPTPTLEGEPVALWNGIPIMQGAITGEGDEEGYVFTIRASSQQVQDYYRLELAAQGWQSLSEEDEGSARVLVFIDTTSTILTVRILTKGDEALVLLTK